MCYDRGRQAMEETMPIDDFTTTLNFVPPSTDTIRIPWNVADQEATIQALRVENSRLARAVYVWRVSAAGLAAGLSAVVVAVGLKWFGVAGEVSGWFGW